MHSWRILILPFLEQQELYDQYDFTQMWNSEVNLSIADKMPRIYCFHDGDDNPRNLTNYLAVVGHATMWPGAVSRRDQDVTDDAESTILFVENLGAGVHWMEPRDLRLATMDFQLNSPDGLSSKYQQPAVAMLDGSLRELDLQLSADTFKAMLTVNGSEQLQREGDTWQVLDDGRNRTLGSQPE